MNILMTGATGLIGSKLAAQLHARGHAVSVLARNPASARRLLPFCKDVFEWDVKSGLPQIEVFTGIDCVVSLAGSPIAVRWNEKSKSEIYNSRVLGTRSLVDSMKLYAKKNQGKHPGIFVSASAIGIYPYDDTKLYNESSEAGSHFLSKVCSDWEKRAWEYLESFPNSRVVIPRIGVVLSQHGGMLDKLLPVLKLGMGGISGSGTQWISWIHIEDLVQGFIVSIENSSVIGPLNLVAPQPVTNAEFTRQLAGLLRRPAVFRQPEFVLKSVLGEMSEVILKGQKVSSAKALQAGLKYHFPNIELALKDLI